MSVMESSSDAAYESIPEDESNWNEKRSHKLVQTTYQRWFARHNIVIILAGVAAAFVLGLVLGVTGTILTLPLYLNVSSPAPTTKDTSSNLAATPVWRRLILLSLYT